METKKNENRNETEKGFYLRKRKGEKVGREKRKKETKTSPPVFSGAAAQKNEGDRKKGKRKETKSCQKRDRDDERE